VERPQVSAATLAEVSSWVEMVPEVDLLFGPVPEFQATLTGTSIEGLPHASAPPLVRSSAVFSTRPLRKPGSVGSPLDEATAGVLRGPGRHLRRTQSRWSFGASALPVVRLRGGGGSPKRTRRRLPPAVPSPLPMSDHDDSGEAKRGVGVEHLADLGADGGHQRVGG
jgi:hypothetical protein